MVLKARNLSDRTTEENDGFVLRATPQDSGPVEPYDPVEPLDFARIVTAGRRKPLLVAISSCYTAQRLAALATAQGALSLPAGNNGSAEAFAPPCKEKRFF